MLKLVFAFFIFFIFAFCCLTSRDAVRQNPSRQIPLYGIVSPWERAYCQLDYLGLSPAELRTRCEEVFREKETGKIDEIKCLSFLTARSTAIEAKPCVASDYTDVSVNMALLLTLRKQQKEKERSKKSMRVRVGRFFKFRRSGVLISLCVKDETRMLLLSMIWHLLLGVEHYFICDNSSRNSSLDRALKPFSGLGLVTIRKYPGHGEIQQRCFDDALKFAGSHGYKWQGGLDTDEFTVLSDRYYSLESALDHFASVTLDHRKKVGAVGFNWLSQAPYNQVSIHYPEDLYTTPAEKTNFVLRNSDKNRHVKSFGLTEEVLSWSHVHMPRYFRKPDTITVNTAGAPLPSIPAMFDTEPSVSDAAVVHFTYRTIQELAAKRERGRATVDCESEESAADPNCAVVHNSRMSKRKVTELAEHYMQLVTKPSEKNQEDQADNVLKDLQNSYRRLGGQVKQIISSGSYTKT